MQQNDDIYCRKCEYHLFVIPGPGCPECGQRFDPGDPSTFMRRKAARVAWLPCVSGVLAWILLVSLLPRFTPPLLTAFEVGMHAFYALMCLVCAGYAAVAGKEANDQARDGSWSGAIAYVLGGIILGLAPIVVGFYLWGALSR